MPILSFCAEEKNKEFSKAVTAYQEKKFDTAIKGFKKVTKQIFGHEPSFYNLGLSYLKTLNYSESLKTFQQAAQYNPYNLITAKLIADLYIITKDYSKASEEFKKIIERNRQDTDAYLKLGALSAKSNDSETAIDKLTFVYNVSPKNTAGTLILAALYIQKNNPEKAKIFLQGAECRNLDDKKIEAFCLILRAWIYKSDNDEKAFKETLESAIAINPNWKTLSEPDVQLEKLQSEFADYILQIYSLEELLRARLLEFEQSEVSKRLSGRLLKEKEEEAKKSPTASAASITASSKKRPFGVTGELNQAIENYNRNPATSNPINDINTTTNLKLEAKIKDINAKAEFETYYNRWDHSALDYYKINLKDNKNDELDLGNFSAKNFPDLISHPTIEEGARWWHSFQFERDASLLKTLPEDFEAFNQEGSLQAPPSLGEIFHKDYFNGQLFKTWELTVLRGVSKIAHNLGDRKLENDKTYETSGQFKQVVNSFHIMTKPTSISEAGFSYSRVKDDEISATTTSTTYPIESEAVGLDGKIDFLDGKLKTDGEFAWSNYDENISSEAKIGRDYAGTFGINYKYIPDWESSYDLKRIGTNFKVEGAYQTQDKITHTFVTKYSAPKTIPWRIRSIDVKYEPAHTNLPKSGTSTTYYTTFQPKISFNLPQDAKASIDYKNYLEDTSCKCTYYRTQTLKGDIEYECKPIKTTFKPSYTFERKNDQVASPTDEKQKDFAFTIENTSIKNLTLRGTFERDLKNYYGASTKAYDNKKYSFEFDYAFIPNRFTSGLKISVDDKKETDTNNIRLDSVDYTLNLTSKDGNKKLALEYELKLNIYDPWLDSSAYRQTYVKAKYTQKF